MKGGYMKVNRGVGRPPVADKAIPRSIKVNDREWQEIKDNAKKANKTVARYLIDLGTKGCRNMYKVIGKKSEKSYREFNTVWDALEEAVRILENRHHATQLSACGTDVEFYKEITGSEPSVELKEDSFILGDGDFFTVVNRSCTLEEANYALSDVAENIYIEEVEEDEE